MKLGLTFGGAHISANALKGLSNQMPKRSRRLVIEDGLYIIHSRTTTITAPTTSTTTTATTTTMMPAKTTTAPTTDDDDNGGSDGNPEANLQDHTGKLRSVT